MVIPAAKAALATHMNANPEQRISLLTSNVAVSEFNSLRILFGQAKILIQKDYTEATPLANSKLFFLIQTY